MDVPGWNGDDGCRNNVNAGSSSLYTADGNDIVIPMTLNESIANHLVNDIDWGYSCIVQGESFIFTKITIE
jgi:hypothetical protein